MLRRNLFIVHGVSEVIPVKIYANMKHAHGLPAYANPCDSGMDIRSNENVTLEPKQTRLIPTGVFVGLPPGYEIQVRPRSGLSLKTKLRVANSIGTIDEGYTGEICVIMENTHGAEPITIATGERIAQLVLQRVPRIEWEQVESIDELGSTERGADGFGSSGVR
jgi:dUTP pyrophosphatase